MATVDAALASGLEPVQKMLLVIGLPATPPCAGTRTGWCRSRGVAGQFVGHGCRNPSRCDDPSNPDIGLETIALPLDPGADAPRRVLPAAGAPVLLW